MYDVLMSRRLLLLLPLLLGFLAPAACRLQGKHKEAPLKFQARILWNSAASPLWKTALPDIEKTLAQSCDTELKAVEIRKSSDWTTKLDAFGKRKIPLIICVGGGFDRAIDLVAPRYPGSTFLLHGSRNIGENIRRLHFETAGAAYLAGVAAGIFSGGESALIRGPGGPWLETIESSFRDGFLAGHSRGKVRTYSSTKALIESSGGKIKGIALYASDKPDPEDLKPAISSGLSLLTITPNADKLDRAPLAGSIVIDLAEALRRVTVATISGSPAGHSYDFDLGSGVIDFRLNSRVPELNTPEAREKLEEARSAITAGVVELEQMGM